MRFRSSRVSSTRSPFTTTESANRLETLDTAHYALGAKTVGRRALRFALPLLSCALLGGLSISSHAEDAAPPAPAAPAPGTVSITGLADIYYQVNARAPQSVAGYVTPSGETIKVDTIGHSFDINDRDPSFSLGEVNITRTPGRGFPLGVTATLTVGDTARIVHANEPGGTSSWQTLQQLYLTYATKIGGKDVSFDFGKWTTPMGYEVIESVNNDNYTRSFGFQYGLPFYHAGLRATATLSSTLTANFGIVNGWNNVADDNEGKSLHAQLMWKPCPKFTGILGYMAGPEGTGAYGAGIAPKGKGSITTQLLDFQPILQVNSKLKLAADIIYGNAYGTVSGVRAEGNWLGLAGYARYQLTPQFAVAGRVEEFEDSAGAGGIGLRTGAAGYTQLHSYTLTAEYAAMRGHMISRLEYRHDTANNSYFNAGTGTSRDQDTITLGEVYKF